MFGALEPGIGGLVWGRGPGVGGRNCCVGVVLMIGLAAEALQLGQRAIVRALGGIDAALEAGEGVIAAVVDVADRGALIEFGERGFARIFDFMGPQFGFEA